MRAFDEIFIEWIGRLTFRKGATWEKSINPHPVTWAQIVPSNQIGRKESPSQQRMQKRTYRMSVNRGNIIPHQILVIISILML